jgi:hypothetical protein
MKRDLRWGLSAFLVLFFAAEPSWALKLNAPTAPPTLVYSPNSVVQGQGSIAVQKGSYVGAFCVTFAQTSLTPAPAEGLSYGLYQPAASPLYALALDGSPTNANEVLSGSFAPTDANNKVLNLNFALLVSPATLPPPGSYQARITVSLYGSAYPPSGGVVGTKTLTLNVTVGSHFDLAVVPKGSAFSLASTSQSLAFGSLAEGDSREADILVRSNVIYSLTLSSAAGGGLACSADGSLLGYALQAGGVLLSLPAGLPASVAAAAPATYSSPARYPVSVDILPFAGLPTEGDYSDSLTLSLSAP